MTTMAAPMMGTTTMAAPMSFATQAAPMTYSTMAAPQVTYATAAPAMVQPRGLDLLAMGTVISERVITIEELADRDRYLAMEAVEVMVQQPVMQAPIMSAPMMMQAAPMTFTSQAAPQYMSYGAPMQTM